MNVFGEKPRLRSLLDHFSVVEDPREPWRVAHPSPAFTVRLPGVGGKDVLGDFGGSHDRRHSLPAHAPGSRHR